MPKTVKTLSVTLEPKLVEKLEKLEKLFGTKSGAVRELLRMHEQLEVQKEWERAYDDYFADPAAAKRDREVTDELLDLASWPENEPERKTEHAAKRKRRPER